MIDLNWLYADTYATAVYAVIAGIFWVTTMVLGLMAWQDRQPVWVWFAWFFLLLTLVTISVSAVRADVPAETVTFFYRAVRSLFLLMAAWAMALSTYVSWRILTVRGRMRTADSSPQGAHR